MKFSAASVELKLKLSSSELFWTNVTCPTGLSTTLSGAPGVSVAPPALDRSEADNGGSDPVIRDVTGIDTVQLLPAKTVPPLKATLLPPGAATTVQPQLVLPTAPAATSNPVGSVASNPNPSTSTEFALLSIVKINVVVSPWRISDGLNRLANAGGTARETVRFADADPLLPSEDVRSPDVVAMDPTRLVVISTETSHVAPRSTDPPLKDKVR